MNEMDNNRKRPDQYCDRCIRTSTLSTDGLRIDGTTSDIYSIVRLPRSTTALGDKKETTRRLIQWGIVACSFVGLIGAFLGIISGG